MKNVKNPDPDLMTRIYSSFDKLSGPIKMLPEELHLSKPSKKKINPADKLLKHFK